MENDDSFYFDQLILLKRKIDAGELDINDVFSDDFMEKYRDLKAKQNERHEK